MNITKVPEVATFETDFGVTFGHFVCFDLLFKSPAFAIVKKNVRHILYPSMWYSQIPFLTSTQIQQQFAQKNNVALLSSGTNSPKNYNTGSGIFVGRLGAVDKIISCKNETTMMVAKVPKNLDDPDYKLADPQVKAYTPVEMDGMKLLYSAPSNMKPLDKLLLATYENIKCEFSVDYKKLDIPVGKIGYSYRMAAYTGVRSLVDAANVGEAYCIIVACTDESDENTCGSRFGSSDNLVPSVAFQSIEIKMTVGDSPEDYLVMPTTLDFSIRPLPVQEYDFKNDINEKEQKYSVKSFGELNSLMTFGIYGRNYKMDGPIN